MNKFIFDVDGTLTPSRGTIDTEFKQWFLDFCDNNLVYLVTGSDRDKTLEQVGIDIYNRCSRVYQCSGNEVWIQDDCVKTSEWKLPQNAHEWLSIQLTDSAFPMRTGQHFEHRSGMCNFSIVGRSADIDARKLYINYDEAHNERNTITDAFNGLFTDLTATAGGETGIDIYPTGKDKSQIIEDFKDCDKIYFFGDRIDINGNDYTLANEVKKITPSGCFHVKNWQETWYSLRYLKQSDA